MPSISARIRRAVLVATGLVALAITACASEGPERQRTALQSAIASAGGGISPTGTGVGWIDVAALDSSELEWAQDALGPGADDLLERSGVVRAELGFDPAEADSALSLGGSYAFAVRLDGIPPGRLPALLEAAGASRAESDRWTTYDLGNPAEGPTRGPLSELGALASRVATAADSVVVARDEGARRSLIRARGGELSAERIELASECLGDVVAARMVPGAFTYNVPVAPELIAFGVAAGGEEVLCTVDDDPAAGAAREGALRSALAPSARDGVSGEPMSELVGGFELGSERAGDKTVTRAAITRAPGTPPGFLFRAFPRGSTLTYLGSRRPIPRE